MDMSDESSGPGSGLELQRRGLAPVLPSLPATLRPIPWSAAWPAWGVPAATHFMHCLLHPLNPVIAFYSMTGIGKVKAGPTTISGTKDAPVSRPIPRAEPGGCMNAEAAGGRWPLRAASLTVAIGLLLARGACAEDRPSAIAPYRYTSPPSVQLDRLERQKAYSYRNELSAQQRSMEVDRALNRNPDVNAASRLRSEGELSRESNRIDSVLQR
jgi:hypothetical protein